LRDNKNSVWLEVLNQTEKNARNFFEWKIVKYFAGDNNVEFSRNIFSNNVFRFKPDSFRFERFSISKNYDGGVVNPKVGKFFSFQTINYRSEPAANFQNFRLVIFGVVSNQA
jgi:hypothetical protein